MPSKKPTKHYKFKRPSKPEIPTIDIADWVEQIVLPLKIKRCYIAIMPIMTPKVHYDLEIETVPFDTIGAVYELDTFNLEKTRKQADKLEAELTKHGIYVCKTRAEWEGEEPWET